MKHGFRLISGMHSTHTNENLANYLAFLERVDDLCGKITAEFAGDIRCKAGCSECCRHLNLFPVEAASMADVVGKLPHETRELLSGRADWSEKSACPLLQDDRCLIYNARPVICRTHGLPLLLEVEGGKKIDFCEENFRGVTSLPGDMVIDLETLNRLLTAINGRFEAESHGTPFGNGRYSIAEIIRMAIG
jgi:Fe-S-cluster containining protein